MKVHRLPVTEWRKNFFATRKGIPSIKSINEAIEQGTISGAVICGKHIVYCKPDYEPLEVNTDLAPVEEKPEVTNPIALRILKAKKG